MNRSSLNISIIGKPLKKMFHFLHPFKGFPLIQILSDELFIYDDKFHKYYVRFYFNLKNFYEFDDIKNLNQEFHISGQFSSLVKFYHNLEIFVEVNSFENIQIKFKIFLF